LEDVMSKHLKPIAGGASGPPATVAEIAAFEFGAIKEFRGLTKAERLRKTHSIADGVRAMAVLAAEIVAMDKPKLIAKVSEKYDVLGALLMEFAEAADDAKALLEIIQSAEARLAVALAVVEGDPPPDDDGSGESVAA
jgi:hypothetical protein